MPSRLLPPLAPKGIAELASNIGHSVFSHMFNISLTDPGSMYSAFATFGQCVGQIRLYTFIAVCTS